MFRCGKMFLFPCALNIMRSVPPADDSCNVSGIALGVLENEVFGSVVSTFAVWSRPIRHRIQRAVKRSGIERGNTRGPRC